MTPFEVLSDEGLELIESNADTILEQVGIDFRDAPEARDLLQAAGAEVDGERVRFPRGLARQLVQATAPRTFTQVARNPANSVEIGGTSTVFAPCLRLAVRARPRGRAPLRDDRGLPQLREAHLRSPWLHHSGGTICEPVDLPVNKRHLDMVYAHLRYSDKPFMGSVTHPERARDTVELARIVFGADFLEENTAILLSLSTRTRRSCGTRRCSARRRPTRRRTRPCCITPFILAGAMSPVTVAGTATQTLAEALAGMAYVQLVRPGAPVVLGSFASSLSMQSGAPTFGTPGACARPLRHGGARRRLGVPFRSGGAFTASKIPDAQAAYESANTMQPTMLGGVNFVLHAAGWLEGGLTMGYEKFVLDADQCGMWHEFAKGVDLSDNGQALDALLTERAGAALPRPRAHARELRDGLLPLAGLRQLELRAVGGGGRADAAHRATAIWKQIARRVRGAADRRRRRRGAARVDRAEEGVVPRLGLLSRPRYGPLDGKARPATAGGSERRLLRHGLARRLTLGRRRVEPAEDRPDALEAVVLERRRQPSRRATFARCDPPSLLVRSRPAP